MQKHKVTNSQILKVEAQDESEEIISKSRIMLGFINSANDFIILKAMGKIC